MAKRNETSEKAKTTTASETAPKTPIVPQISYSARFTAKVETELASKTGTSLELSEYQKRLIQNYFLGIDASLKMAEDKRMKKAQSKRDSLSVTWQNINMQSLAIDVVARSRIGYDPALPNQINMIPYKNNTTQKYDVVFIEGYRGLEMRAMKYALNTPTDIIVKLVYENDEFTPIMKDDTNTIESYIFKVTRPFDRGEVIGGFYYHRFKEDGEKNHLVMLSLSQIEKRKPKYASTEFWGGEKDVWQNGKTTGEKIQVDGWREKMLEKTVFRAAYSDITIDGKKVDDAFMSVLNSEATNRDRIENKGNYIRDDSERIIEENANLEEIDMEDAEIVTAKDPEALEPTKSANTENNTESYADYKKGKESEYPPENNAPPEDPQAQKSTEPKLGF